MDGLIGILPLNLWGPCHLLSHLDFHRLLSNLQRQSSRRPQHDQTLASFQPTILRFKANRSGSCGFGM